MTTNVIISKKNLLFFRINIINKFCKSFAVNCETAPFLLEGQALRSAFTLRSFAYMYIRKKILVYYSYMYSQNFYYFLATKIELILKAEDCIQYKIWASLCFCGVLLLIRFFFLLNAFYDICRNKYR